MSNDSMAVGWYYSRQGGAGGGLPADTVGPLSWAELCAAAQAGAFAPDDLVWHPEFPSWVPAAQVPGLTAAAAPALARPPVGPALARPAVQPGAAPAARPARRPSWLVPVLIPVITLLLIGAGIGAYFGLRGGGDDETADVGTTVTTEAGSGGGTATTQGGWGGDPTGGVDIGTIEVTLPDRSSLIETEAWGEVPANQIGVVLAEGKTRADAEQIAQTLGGTVIGELEYLNLFQIETAGSTEADLTAALNAAAATAGVEIAFPNQQVYLDDDIWGVRRSPLNDPAYSGALGKSNELIGTQRAWDYIKGSGLPISPVKAGFLDEGLYKGTGEFSGSTRYEFPDPAAGEIANPVLEKQPDGSMVANPNGSHGVMTVGIMGADPENGGQTGIASTVLGDNLSISVIDIFGGQYGYQPAQVPDPNDPTQFVETNGQSYTAGSLAAALKQVQNDADVINCSFGAGQFGPANAPVAAAWTRLFQKMARDHPDVIFVCSAGNNNGAISKTNCFPAGAGSGEPNVITVGNVMNDGGKWDTSNYAAPDGEVTISAPGHEAVQGVDKDGRPIVAGYNHGGYTAPGGGTSAAAPMVSSAVALLKSLNPKLSAAQIKDILTRTAKPGPENMGGILSIDEAVFEVISQVRKDMKLPELTREQLLGMGAIDAVATSTDDPNVYAVRAIMAVIPEGGVEVTLTPAGGVTLNGATTQSAPGPAADLELGTVTVPDPGATTSGDVPSLTVTRKDSGAASVISFEEIDINGHWTGTFTITEVNITSDEAKQSAEQQGCSLEFLNDLKGKPLPMTMDITIEDSGKGSVTWVIDTSSLQQPDGESLESSPKTYEATFSGDTLTIQLPPSDTGTMTMVGRVSKKDGGLVLTGELAVKDQSGYSLKAVWTLKRE